jgi:hypothetical protein
MIGRRVPQLTNEPYMQEVISNTKKKKPWSALHIGEGLIPRASPNLSVVTSRVIAVGVGPQN